MAIQLPIKQDTDESPGEYYLPTTVIAPGTALAYVQIADELFQSGLYSHLKTKGGVLAAVLDGREKGIGIMTALQNMVVINNKLAYSAQLVMALARQRAGVSWKVLENNTKGCKMQFSRPGFDSLIVSFTEDDARAAGLLREGSGYSKYPADMYFARCGVKGCRRIAPDAVTGLYSIDELTEGQYTEVEEIPADNVVEVEGFTAETKPKRSAQKPAKPNGNGTYVFTFGKYNGKSVAEVPAEYLEWCLEKIDPDDKKNGGKYADANRTILVACKRELARRTESDNGDEPEPQTDEPDRNAIITEIVKLEENYTRLNPGVTPDEMLEERRRMVGTSKLEDAETEALSAYRGTLKELADAKA